MTFNLIMIILLLVATGVLLLYVYYKSKNDETTFARTLGKLIEDNAAHLAFFIAEGSTFLEVFVLSDISSRHSDIPFMSAFNRFVVVGAIEATLSFLCLNLLTRFFDELYTGGKDGVKESKLLAMYFGMYIATWFAGLVSTLVIYNLYLESIGIEIPMIQFLSYTSYYFGPVFNTPEIGQLTEMSAMVTILITPAINLIAPLLLLNHYTGKPKEYYDLIKAKRAKENAAYKEQLKEFLEESTETESSPAPIVPTVITSNDPPQTFLLGPNSVKTNSPSQFINGRLGMIVQYINSNKEAKDYFKEKHNNHVIDIKYLQTFYKVGDNNFSINALNLMLYKIHIKASPIELVKVFN